MLVIGLTGNLSSGKTTVLKLLKTKGALVYNCDQRVHYYYRNQKGPVYKKVASLFPESLKRKRICRKRLAQTVFSDHKKLIRLERVVHPVIIKDLVNWIKNCRRKFKNKNKICVAEAPLLFEKKLQKYFDFVVLVKLKSQLQHRRINKLSGSQKVLARKRLSFYKPLREKIKGSDFVINNNANIKNLAKEVDLLWKNLKLK